MWKSFHLENAIFLIKFESGSTHKLYLTDLRTLWMEELDDDDLQNRFKTLNPLYVDANVVEEIEALVTTAPTETIKLTKEDTVVNFEIGMVVDDLPLKYYWVLDEQSPDEFFRIFTLNLINTIQYLELEQGRLLEVIIKKDKEIEESKREYGEISRDILKTEKFVQKDAIDSAGRELLLTTLTNKEVFPLLMNKYGSEAVKMKSKSLEKVEPKKRKLRLYKPRLAS